MTAVPAIATHLQIPYRPPLRRAREGTMRPDVSSSGEVLHIGTRLIGARVSRGSLLILS
ncbi:MAG TPA: hypothetical protein VGR26_11560 [Acidimicrobiales bacterium]|nr:hypothetical protein [Acidimicrobiales bacterium]